MPADFAAAAGVEPASARPVGRSRGVLTRARLGLGGIGAAVLGAAPHVLHHAGPLAGAALLGGLAGSLLFGVLGFVLAVPLLLRLRRRTGSWRLPGAALGLFLVLFVLSTTVVGPVLTGRTGADSEQRREGAPPGVSPVEHERHHAR